jgi:hypothetical protein
MRQRRQLRQLIFVAAVMSVVLAISIAYGVQHTHVRAIVSPTPKSAVLHDQPGPVTSVSPMPIALVEQTGSRTAVYSGGGVPKRFTIWHDSFEAKWTGTTLSGDQFYFGPQGDVGGSNPDYFDVLFRWSSNGEFRSAHVVDLGPRPSVATQQAAESQILSTLGKFRLGDLYVQPFGVLAFGIRFGFIPAPPSDGYPVAVELLPENNMAFTSPWTYGHYDT